MRAPIIIALFSGAIGAVVACAASGAQESDERGPIDDGDAGSTVIGDASSQQPRDASEDRFDEVPTCSPAGWCRTELPASGLVLVDVWPVGDRAFGLVARQVGRLLLEWDAVTGWKFIDAKMGFTNTTNPVNVWAPDENEVFFTVWDLGGTGGTGTNGAVLLRGTRPTAPETTWSWVRSRIDCPAGPSPSKPFLWGVSRDEVYTAVCGKVYRLNRNAIIGDAGMEGADASVDGGATVGDGWDLEYTDSEPNFQLWSSVTGTGSDDVWFTGARAVGANQCVLVVRKSSEGYTTVVDGVPTAGVGCAPKPGVAMIKGRFDHLDAPANGRIIGVPTTSIDNELVQVAVVDSGIEITRASPAATMDVQLSSVWASSANDIWMLAGRGAAAQGTNTILRATSVWGDAGKFEFSTLAINGAPNLAPLRRIRGTSNGKLWAVGSDRAYFKSTP